MRPAAPAPCRRAVRGAPAFGRCALPPHHAGRGVDDLLIEFAPIVADRLDLALEPRFALERSALLGAERFQLLVACFERTEICGWGLGRRRARRLRRRGDEVER